MKLYQNLGLKPIQLTRDMALLSHTIIQVNSIFIRYKNEVEKSLSRKIEIAKNGCRPGHAMTVYLTEPERKRMRQHNMDYCCMLSKNVAALEDIAGSSIANGLETYQMVTRLHFLFSSQ